MQGGWGGEGGLVRMSSGRGGRRSPRNVDRPSEGERLTATRNEAHTELYGEEDSSNIPPWVVNVSKVI